ncbi:uncharacterized protein BXZ73DRAFT_91973 [Epithele typhae]|uniref:uncharacterized protein n=1 Tax=Epithele typhae TaxID=378194 RepID=UPI002008056A|nr:uncharacterized protein BXZ73DRAFT_91973 [Epithele typhae]KAH9920243.1 hypothetical protein BXZ73DRAFT_91973 [Epithele typhae]
MASLNSLLNPESAYETSVRDTPPASAPRGVIRAHEPHPDCPDTLACLPDTEGRPQHTLPVILRCTILGSPRKRLTIREIYAAMERKYPYYKTAGPAWKQSVRHHLSLNRLFERQPRPPSDPGFGSYWTVNLDAPPGTKRPRKRGRNNKTDTSGDGLAGGMLPMRNSHLHPSANPHAHQQSVPSMPKLRPVDSHSFKSPAERNYYDDDDDEEDDEMEWEDEADVPRFTDEEYSSSEDMPYQYDPRSHNRGPNSFPGAGHRTHSTPQSQPGRGGPGLHGAFSSYSALDHQDTIERLKMEMAGLRRQSQDATSQQMRAAEKMLEEETRRRVQAEKVADDEVKRRRQAEDQLRALRVQNQQQRKYGP